MYLDDHKKEIKNISRELKLMENSIRHLRYIINYITRRHSVYIEGIRRAHILLDLLRKEIRYIRQNIKKILDEEISPERTLERIKLVKIAVSNVEKVIGIIERYIIQRGECIMVIQNWPSLYTLSSITSPEIVYVVYESFAKLVLRLLGFNDLEEKPPIIVFGGARSGGTNAETYTDYRIIILPRQARYDIRYLTYILHEAIHIATRHKIKDDSWRRMYELSSRFIDEFSKYHPGLDKLLNEKIDDEVLVELIKRSLIKRVIHNVPDINNADETAYWLMDFHDKIDYFINKTINLCKLSELDESRCIRFIDEFLLKNNTIDEYLNSSINYNGYENDLNNFRAVLYLLTIIEELLEEAKNNDGFTSFLPSSFMYAYRVLFDNGINARLNEVETELERINIWKSIAEEINNYLRDPIYVLALIKLPTDQAWKDDVKKYLDQKIVRFLNTQLQHTNLLEIYAVTGWFDYLIIMNTQDVISVVGVIDELLASGSLEDGVVITGKLLHIHDGDKSVEGMSNENVCGYAFLLMDIVHRHNQQPYSEQINQIKNELLRIINEMNDRLEFALLKTMNRTNIPAIFHVFGKYDMAVLLRIKRDMNSLIQLITRLKSHLYKYKIIIETQTIPCCLSIVNTTSQNSTISSKQEQQGL